MSETRTRREKRTTSSRPLAGAALITALVACAAGASAAQTPPTILHKFTGGATDGENPRGSLTVVGSTLYGTTEGGGAEDRGTIFKINAGGGGYQMMRSFTSADPYNPEGPLTAVGSTLYGTARSGASGQVGGIFKINADGTGFGTVRSFSNSFGAPQGVDEQLLAVGSTLYGVTDHGGNTSDNGLGWGTVFSIDTNGANFQPRHLFSSSHGNIPTSGLVLGTQPAPTLYGMTNLGGANNAGTIFKMAPDGSDFHTLHSFAGLGDGQPEGSLLLVGSTLFGMNTGNGSGKLFRIDTDGTDYQVLRSFSFGDSTDGYRPNGSPIMVNGKLYGMTSFPNSNGAIFRIDPDGTGYELLHTFAGGADDGAHPLGDLVAIGNTLYGLTSRGGMNNDGTIFSIVVPEPSATLLALALLLPVLRRARRA